MSTSHPKKPPEDEVFIGLISGTSMDGVDVVAGDFSGEGVKVLYARTFPYPERLRKLLEHIVFTGGSAEEISRTHFAVGDFFGRCARVCVDELGTARAIGSHGQTVCHCPERKGDLPGATLQIGEPWKIVQHTGLPVYYDFRSYFVGQGKNGAPLAHLLHQRLFSSVRCIGVLNIGGIANLTVIKNGRSYLSFDTGPGAGIIDEGVKIVTCEKERCDRDGAFSMKGEVHRKALNYALEHPYFKKRPPKSTGKRAFGRDFVLHLMERYPSLKSHPSTLVRTLVEITARSIVNAVEKYAREAEVLVLCGGGRKHPLLVGRLRELLGRIQVVPSEQFGIDGDFIEGLLMAYLAYLASRGIYPAKLASPVIKEGDLYALYIP